MSNQSATGQMTEGVMVSFDILDRKDVKDVQRRVTEKLGLEPSVEKLYHATFLQRPVMSYEPSRTSWKLESLQQLRKLLGDMCRGYQWRWPSIDRPPDLGMVVDCIQSFQVHGYDHPRFPYYVLMAQAELNVDAVSLSDDLKETLWQVALAIRVFVENLGGLTKSVVNYRPSPPVVTQLRIRVGKENLCRIQETAMKCINKEAPKTIEQRTELSEALRALEPVDLSDSLGDHVHSHIVGFSSVVAVLGHMRQPSEGGMQTPYILELTHDQPVLPDYFETNAKSDKFVLFSGGGLSFIVSQGYPFLVALISMLLYLWYLDAERTKIDSQLSVLRTAITKSSRHTVDELRETLSELSEFGTKTSSFLSALGVFSRQWEEAVNLTSKGKDPWTTEVPIEPSIFLGASPHVESDFRPKGYVGTLASNIIRALENCREDFGKQKSEIVSWRNHLSDLISLAVSKSNENLQLSMKRLTQVSVVLAISAILVSLYLGWYGLQLRDLDYRRTHPEGKYFVSVDFLGYSNTTRRDHFRIKICYLGEGVSKFIRLTLAITGVNPVVVSKVNVEVMEPDIVLARNYVDGLIGWVDYTIQRSASMNRTELTVHEFSSDVRAKLTYNL